MIDHMKLQTKLDMHTSRVFRDEHKKAQRIFGKVPEGANNFTKADAHWDVCRLGAMRLICKEEARHLHLARAFLKGVKYKEVENKVREHNEPDPYLIEEVLEKYNVHCFSEYILAWLSDEQ